MEFQAGYIGDDSDPTNIEYDASHVKISRQEIRPGGPSQLNLIFDPETKKTEKNFDIQRPKQLIKILKAHTLELMSENLPIILEGEIELLIVHNPQNKLDISGSCTIKKIVLINLTDTYLLDRAESSILFLEGKIDGKSYRKKTIDYLILFDVSIEYNPMKRFLFDANKVWLLGVKLNSEIPIIYTRELLLASMCPARTLVSAWMNFNEGTADLKKYSLDLSPLEFIPKHALQEIYKKVELFIFFDSRSFLRNVENALIDNEVREYQVAARVCVHRNKLEYQALRWKCGTILTKLMYLFNNVTSKYQTSISRPIGIFLGIMFLVSVLIWICESDCYSMFQSACYFDEGKAILPLKIITKPWTLSLDHPGYFLLGTILIPILASLAFMAKHAYNRQTNYKW